MIENWIEGIKRNDEMTMLDRYFPGKSCGNTECERHCIELCKIAERMGGMKKDEIVSAVARVLVYPETCPALKSGQNHESCRFLLLSHDRISAYDDRTGRRIIGKKYISDADASKSGACKKCLEYANRIFRWPEEADKMPKLPLHPNCKCHYEDVYENIERCQLPKNMIKAAFNLSKMYAIAKLQNVTEEYISEIYHWISTVRTVHLTAPILAEASISILNAKLESGTAMFNIKQAEPDRILQLFGKTIDGYDDLINQLKKRYTPVKKLVLIGHNASPGTMNIGSGCTLDELTSNQVARLKKYLAPDCIIYVRACHDAQGIDAQKKYKRFAKRIKCLVVAYQGLVTPLGTGKIAALDAGENGVSFVWYAKCSPIVFSPY